MSFGCEVGSHYFESTLHQHATNPNTTLPSSADGRVGMVGDVERVLVEIGCRGMLLLVVQSLGTVGAAVSGWFAAVVVGFSVLVSFGVGISSRSKDTIFIKCN
ncbi:hypothetical protein GQ457_10G003990 [Hibiscus cannabinus]